MKESSQPTNSMTSKSGCFYGGCDESPTWGIESSVAAKNPDGSPLCLYTCDEHEQVLTADLRRAGTKYTLFPVIGPPLVPSCSCPPIEVSYEQEFAKLPTPQRWIVNGLVVGVMCIIGPPMLLYYGVKRLFGSAPTEDS